MAQTPSAPPVTGTRRPRARRRLRALLRWACLLAGTYLGAGAAIAWFAVAPRHRPITDSPARHGMPVFERIAVRARDGTRLAGWYVPSPSQPARGAVVLCHGIDGDRTSLLPAAAILHRHGYAALLLDFRAHGESGGSRCTLGHLEGLDVLAALDWLQGRAETRDLPWALVGHSMGGAVVLNSHGASGVAVVAESPFARLDHAIDNQFRTKLGWLGPPMELPARWFGERLIGTSARNVAPVEHIGCLAPGTRVLLIQDADDTLCPPAETRALVAASSGRAQLWTVPKAGHVGAVRTAPAEYERRVVSFLDEAFKQDASRPAP